MKFTFLLLIIDKFHCFCFNPKNNNNTFISLFVLCSAKIIEREPTLNIERERNEYYWPAYEIFLKANKKFHFYLSSLFFQMKNIFSKWDGMCRGLSLYVSVSAHFKGKKKNLRIRKHIFNIKFNLLWRLRSVWTPYFVCEKLFPGSFLFCFLLLSLSHSLFLFFLTWLYLLIDFLFSCCAFEIATKRREGERERSDSEKWDWLMNSIRIIRN